ncbi:MAG TPA: HAD family hydrolase [Clostridia bacterium]|nr:HAD family hydrolase [Clostridia bacterium]
MNQDIRAIFLDLGGTFRIVTPDGAYTSAAKKLIAELVGTEIEPEAFYDLVMERYEDYRKWALRFLCEAPEAMLWSRWLAPDYDRARVEKHAVELTYALRRAKGRRVVVPEGEETVKILVARGYKVGVISDLVGTVEIDEWLDESGMRPYFCTVQQSSVTLLRKPHPAIYLLALNEAGVRPEQGVFVGDNLERDIIGAKAVGFGATVAVDYPDAAPLKITDENRPDGIIQSFTQLLDIFPAAPGISLGAYEQRSV